jgi:hypothetical protein
VGILLRKACLLTNQPRVRPTFWKCLAPSVLPNIKLNHSYELIEICCPHMNGRACRTRQQTHTTLHNITCGKSWETLINPPRPPSPPPSLRICSTPFSICPFSTLHGFVLNCVPWFFMFCKKNVTYYVLHILLHQAKIELRTSPITKKSTN